MAQIKLYDSGNTIKILWGTDEVEQFVTKLYSVHLVEITGEKSYVQIIEENEISTKIYFDDITVPVLVNIGALVTLLEGWNDTTSGALVTLAAEHAEDTVHTTGDIGIPSWAVRQDTPAPFSTNLRYSPVITDNLNYLWVHDKHSTVMAASLATIAADTTIIQATTYLEGSGFIAGNRGVLSLAVINAAGTTLLGDEDLITLQADDEGCLWTHDKRLDNLTHAEDTVHTTGDIGIQMLAVRNDLGVALSGTDLDYTPIATKDNGYIKNANYDDTEQSDKVIEQSPDRNHKITETYSHDYLVGTGVGQVYWLIPCDTFAKGKSIYFKVVGDNVGDSTTVKMYSTNDPDVTQAVTQALLASEDWNDVSLSLMKVASVNPTGVGTDKYTFFLDTTIVCEYIVVEFDVTAIAGTDINFTGFAKLT